jgi:crotonobetainyl-CoA:carnitine CoA-transferase CaiB-like acyl-CoA transferase
MNSSGTLSGLSVIDFTQIAAGPTCTMMLADRGADVVKIEAPGGDLGRTLGPPFIGGHGAIFLSLNRNKRSAVLDLKAKRDLEVVRSLITHADIVVESFRPGVMARLGLDYASTSASNSRLIYCSISAYGQQGPFSGKPGVDGIIQATSGLMSVMGTADGVPVKVQAPVIDMVTGFLATMAVLDALMLRERSGHGAWLDISMYGAGIQMQQTGLALYFASGELPIPSGSAAPYAAPNEAFPTADRWVMVAAYQPKRWATLCEILGIPDLVADPLFSSPDLRVANRNAMVKRLSAQTILWASIDLLAALEARDIICGPVNTYADVTAYAPFAGMTDSFEHPEVGQFRVVGPPSTGSDGAYRTGPMRPAPLLGEHTSEVIELALKLRPPS